MKYLVYMSTAHKLMSENELLDILTISRQNNTANKLTGMLLYGEGSFVQVLEGEETVVNTVFDRIEHDPRHKHIIIIASGNQKHRNFTDWSMGLKTVNRDVISQFSGFKDVSGSNFKDLLNDHPAVIVLKTFAETNKLT
ncbi:BLUF domain-containing protein [Mucilaginibacter ginkgonis]|uniref:BLUF domain-containing protein n=1 Tax=Mucilaginibacter ginkgonis TaxID=2682091 RepID=A0A7T7FBK0_9SPHI|nr:BLUF domain-containing protein [Mucilaginibacter ginkgonis]QQL50358.1 BLUF domain-containing protein [Mucilaginibacter ginkgonis]